MEKQNTGSVIVGGEREIEGTLILYTHAESQGFLTKREVGGQVTSECAEL